MATFKNGAKLQKVQLAMLDQDVQDKFTGYDTSIGSLSQLNTTDKSSLVNALKEIKTQATNMGNGSPKGIYTYFSDLQSAHSTGDTNIYLVLGNVKEVDTLNVTAAPTVAGNVTVTLNGVATNIAVTAGVAEVSSLTISAIPTTAGNITVTLNGVATNIAVDPATDTTTDAVATKIRNTVFTGWTTGGTSSTVTFTATSVGVKTDATFSAGSTSATGTMSTTTQGVDADTTTSVATKIRGTSFSGWTTGGTGTTITFTATTAGTKTAPSYSAGTTSATGTISVTTVGANTDGNWYYWNGSAWTAGGVYQATSNQDELIDGRTDNKGFVWNNIGSAIRNSVDGKYLFYKTSSATETDNVSIGFGTSIVITLQNTGASSGYFTLQLKRANGSVMLTPINSALIASGGTVTYTGKLVEDASSLTITNTNSQQCVLSITASSISDKINANNQSIQTVSRKVISTEYFNGRYGYLNNAGVISPATSGTNVLSDPIYNISLGDTFQFNGGYSGWSPVWGYKSDGTAVSLLPAGVYTNYVFTINRSDLVYIQAFDGSGNGGSSIKNIPQLQLVNNMVVQNANCLRMKDLSTTNYSSTTTNKTLSGATVTFISATNANAYFNSASTNIVAGDYFTIRIKIQSNSSANLTFVIYPSLSEIEYEYNYNLTANVEKEIYIRTKNFTTSGTLHFGFQIDSSVNTGQVITVNDLMIVKNSYDTWYDYTTLRTFKNYNTRNYVVDCNGGGHFYDINQALIFAKRVNDVNNIPVTINIKNGYYLQSPTNTFPYACINKGANKISLIGESKDGVIIECYNTSTVQSRIIEHGGESSIENITFNVLNDGTYNAGNDLGHNCYGIHNDTPPSVTPTKQYRTTVKNCRVYSECHSPIGAGLRDHQIQRYENCEFVSNGILGVGALYVHGSNDLSGTNMGLDIINCSCVSQDGTKAITLPDVAGALQYVDIPVTIQRTIGYTTGAKLTDDNFKTTHKLQPQSALNNVVDWNY